MSAGTADGDQPRVPARRSGPTGAPHRHPRRDRRTRPIVAVGIRRILERRPDIDTPRTALDRGRPEGAAAAIAGRHATDLPVPGSIREWVPGCARRIPTAGWSSSPARSHWPRHHRRRDRQHDLRRRLPHARAAHCGDPPRRPQGMAGAQRRSRSGRRPGDGRAAPGCSWMLRRRSISRRRADILDLVARGMRNREIGEVLASRSRR